MIRLWVILLYVMFPGSSLQTAAPDNAGTEFILGFPESTDADRDVLLYITTVKTKTVNVLVTAPKFLWVSISETSFSVTSGVTKQITISANIRMAETQKGTKGILVTADDEISVFGLDSETESCDFFVAMPTDVLGTDYFIITKDSTSTQSQVLLVGVNDTTAVVISLGEALDSNTVDYEQNAFGSGGRITINLNRFETFHFISEGDLSGTKITADKDIAVFSGNIKTAPSISIANLGQAPETQYVRIIEQLPAVKTFGTHFITSPIPKHGTSNVLKIVASENKIIVAITCGNRSVVSLPFSRAGEIAVYNIMSSEHCFIEANRPILLAQFSTGKTNTSDSKDSTMMIIPSIKQYGADYTFTTPTSLATDQFENMLMLIVKAGEQNGLKINGTKFTAFNKFQSVDETEYLVGHFRVSGGSHTVRHTSPTVTFGGYLYGTTPTQLYMTTAGARFAPINTLCSRSDSTVGDGLDNDCDGRIDEELCVLTPTRAEIDDDDQDELSNEDCAKLAAVDGGWTDWSNYSGCSVTCVEEDVPRNGTQTRGRSCSNPEPANDGMPCTGSDTEFRTCSSTSICPKSYILGFMETADDASHLVSILNIDDNNANITVLSRSGVIQMKHVNSTETTVVPVDTTFTVIGSRLSSNAIRVLSDHHIVVYGFNSQPSTTSHMAGFIATEENSLGTTYFAVTTNALVGEVSLPQILIVASQSNTRVNVSIRLLNGEENGVEINNVFYGNGDVFSIVMEEYDTLQIQSQFGDLTGTRVLSDRLVNVFSGNKGVIPGPNDNHLVEQLPPVNNWGTKFVSIAPTNAVYQCKIVSLYPNTRVDYTCSSDSSQLSVILDDEGAHRTLQFDTETCNFVSDQPIMIAMFTNRNYGNPSMVILQPLESVSGNLVFKIPENIVGAEIILATQNESLQHITVDCKAMTGQVAVVEGMISSQKSVGSGIHIIRTNGSSVLLAGYIHGWEQSSTFSYPLVINSSLAKGRDAFQQKCGSSTGNSNDVVSRPSTAAVIVTTETSTQTPSSTSVLMETVQSTGVLTETVLSTGVLTETVPSTSVLTETVPSTGVLTETVPSTDVLTETVPSTGVLTETSLSSAISTDSIRLTGALTETIQSTSALAGTIQSTPSLIETIQSAPSLTETIRPTATARQDTTETFPSTAVFTEFIQSTPAGTDNSTFSCSSCSSCGNHSYANYTTEELLAIIEQLRAELLVHRNATTSYKRTKISAKDNRPSAKAIGFVGCLLLVMAGLGILAMDAGYLLEIIKTIKRNVCPV